MTDEIQVTMHLTEQQHHEAIREWAAKRGYEVVETIFNVDRDDRSGRQIITVEAMAKRTADFRIEGEPKPQTREEKHAAWIAAGNRGIDPDYPEDRSDL